MTVVWEDPPSTTGRSGSSVYRPRLNEVQQHPGKWALIGESKSVGLVHLLKGYTAQLGGEWEFTTRRVAKGEDRANVYVRYLGPSS